MLAYFLILIALVLVNGLFAMAELSLFSSRATRLEQLGREGSRGARAKSGDQRPRPAGGRETRARSDRRDHPW